MHLRAGDNDYTVMLEADGDDLVVYERGPYGHRKEVARQSTEPLKDAAQNALAEVMLNWHAERLTDEQRVKYEWVLEAKPQLDPFLLIGVVIYIRNGASRKTIARMAGITEGQIEGI